MANSIEWQHRLLLSLVLSAGIVAVSGVAFLALDSQAGVGKRPSNATEIGKDVLGIPFAPGALVVSLVFGEWRAVHQGQIALVPFVSTAIDTFIVFFVWEFFRKKRSSEILRFAQEDRAGLVGCIGKYESNFVVIVRGVIPSGSSAQ